MEHYEDETWPVPLEVEWPSHKGGAGLGSFPLSHRGSKSGSWPIPL